ncbi:hypothetical protein ACFD7P_000290 [Vibrio vulnificus]
MRGTIVQQVPQVCITAALTSCCRFALLRVMHLQTQHTVGAENGFPRTRERRQAMWLDVSVHFRCYCQFAIAQTVSSSLLFTTRYRHFGIAL